MENRRNWLELWAWILVSVGIIAIVVFGLRLSSEYTLLPSADLALAETAQVGDFIGGFVGALWSLAGVLLFYSALRLQRREFKLQSNELQDHRQEVTITRITSVIYKQLELLSLKENDLSYFQYSLRGSGFPQSGLAAMHAFTTQAELMSLETEFDRYKSQIFGKVINYIDSQQFQNQLAVLKTTFLLVFKLIEKTKVIRTDSRDSLKDTVLDNSQQIHLYQLLKLNLDYLELENYFTNIKKFLNHRRTLILKGMSEAVDEQIASYEQQIKDVESHLSRVNEIDELYKELKEKAF